jgi:hypothetical protein
VALGACLGRDGSAIAGSGVHGFRFGRDVESGRELEVVTFCDDICPDNTEPGIRYVDPIDRIECLCMGDTPLHTRGWGGYIGCAPSRLPRDWLAYSVEETTVGDEPRFGARAYPDEWRLDLLGLGRSGDWLVRIDGARVKTSGEVRAFLDRYPRIRPSVVDIESNGRDRTIRYAERGVFGRLWERASAARAKDGVELDRHSATEGPTIWADRWRKRFDPSRDDASAEAWRQLIDAIEAAVRDRPRHAAAPVPGAEDCAWVRDHGTRLAVEHGTHTVEVRYVAWLSDSARKRASVAGHTAR